MSITALPTKTAAVVLEGVTKTYGGGEGSVRALDDVSLAFERGTFTAIMDPSGSGKTTLVQAAAELDRPDHGTVRIGDAELTRMGEKRLARLRRPVTTAVRAAFHFGTPDAATDWRPYQLGSTMLAWSPEVLTQAKSRRQPLS